MIATDGSDDRPHRARGEVDAMEAGGRGSGYGEFLHQALGRSGYTWRNGRRQS
nr:hypothetical protein [Kibdelosporangium sp. MJ126-NF4]